jgi:hypothetical protein
VASEKTAYGRAQTGKPCTGNQDLGRAILTTAIKGFNMKTIWTNNQGACFCPHLLWFDMDPWSHSWSLLKPVQGYIFRECKINIS